MLLLRAGVLGVASLFLAAACGARTPLEPGDERGGDPGQGTSGGGASSSASSGGGSDCTADPELVPMLWYPFDGDTRNVGYYGGGLFDAYGTDTTFTPGLSGQSIEIVVPVARVELRSGEVPFAKVDAMSLFIRFQEMLAPALGTGLFHDRSVTSGFELYRGVSEGVMTLCWGAGHPDTGPGGCNQMSLMPDGAWHEWLLSRPNRMAAAEVRIDGALVATLATSGFDLFAGGLTPLLGDHTGGDGILRVDDLRLYDDALDARGRCRELGGAWCGDCPR